MSDEAHRWMGKLPRAEFDMLLALLREAEAKARLQGARAMQDAAAADVATWFPHGTMDKPEFAAGKALHDSIRALNPSEIVKEIKP